jgi:SagB-type dehydrogenase family enzyme
LALKPEADAALLETPVPRLRRARSLVVFFERRRAVAWNFISRRGFVVTGAVISLLASLEDWCEPRQLFDRFKEFDQRSVAREIGRLLEVGALVAEGTEAAADDVAYEESWEWGWSAGAYHFGVKNGRYANDEETREILIARIAARTAPHLVARAGENAYFLPPVTLDGSLQRAVCGRRSDRVFGSRPLVAEELAICLFDGFGVTGYVDDAVLGRMPLTTSPSGGARNPYDGYVYILNVEGIAPGVYRYSGVDHALDVIAASPMPPAAALLSDQRWADDAAAVVFLVANFDRTAFKYGHPSAYRVVLIEAGHIGQNIQLGATECGLASAPTCALQDAPIEALFGLDQMRQAAVYAVAIGARR